MGEEAAGSLEFVVEQPAALEQEGRVEPCRPVVQLDFGQVDRPWNYLSSIFIASGLTPGSNHLRRGYPRVTLTLEAKEKG